MHRHLAAAQNTTLEKLRHFDTCTVSNAIEKFRLRTRNEGFVNGSVRCMIPLIEPRIGYAVTARIRTSATPIGDRWYYERMDWWSYLLTIPAPRFIVAEDVDHVPGLGALFGEIHAHISKALSAVAYATNGAVRDLPGIEAAGIQVFAGNIAVSHAYAHVVEFGEPIEIGGLQIKPGDLLHGDQHGIVSIPFSVVEELPQVAAEILDTEKELIEFCSSPHFSFQQLSEKIQRVSAKAGKPNL
jgi:4-hydroxy-4-methyl-2-oxoglutarate aldolase